MGVQEGDDLANNDENEERKILFLDYLETKMNEIYENSKNHDYFVLGTSTQGYGVYYPLRIETLHPLFQIQYQEVHFSDVFPNQTFYMPINGSFAVNPSTNPDLSGLVDYNAVDQTFIDIPFQYNDNLAIKLTYYPKSTQYLNRPLGPRSYKVLLNMSMEMEKPVVFDDAFLIQSIGVDYSGTNVDVSDLYIRKGTIEADNDLSKNVFQSSGYNNHLIWMFWNDTGTLDGETTGISPFNYYPRLKDISKIEFKTNQGNDASETRNWKLEIYTRKLDIDEEYNYGNKFTTQTQDQNYHVTSWFTHDLSGLMWNDMSDGSGNFESIKGQTTSPYENDLNENQQILGIAFTLSDDSSYYGFQGKLGEVMIEFHDGRIIYEILNAT
jgi:hypothetical protein